MALHRAYGDRAIDRLRRADTWDNAAMTRSPNGRFPTTVWTGAALDTLRSMAALATPSVTIDREGVVRRRRPRDLRHHSRACDGEVILYSVDLLELPTATLPPQGYFCQSPIHSD
jgi:hypothetical protein